MTQPDRPDTLKTRVDQLTHANDAALETIAKQGAQLNGASTFTLGVRLEALADVLLGDPDNTQRLNYELRVQQKFADIILQAHEQIEAAKAQAASQAARAKLLEGVNGTAVPNGLPPR